MQRNTVAYDEGQPRKLERAIAIRDAISDLPAVLFILASSFSFLFSDFPHDFKVIRCYRSQIMKLVKKCHTKILQKQNFKDI